MAVLPSLRWQCFSFARMAVFLMRGTGLSILMIVRLQLCKVYGRRKAVLQSERGERIAVFPSLRCPDGSVLVLLGWHFF